MRNRYFLAFDLLALPCAAYLAFVLRLDRLDISPYWSTLALMAVLIVAIAPLVFRWMGVYSRYWPFASVGELMLIAGSMTIMVVAVSVTHFTATGVGLVESLSLPRSIPFIFLLLATATVGGPRLFWRLVAARGSRETKQGSVERALIVGAGQSGMITARELRQNPHLGRYPVGFLDDDPDKIGTRILGIPVLGGRHDLPAIVAQHRITSVIIAMPAAPGKIIRDVVRLCDEAGIQPQILPGISRLLDSQVIVDHLRRVEIEDLLRREPVQTDLRAVGDVIEGQCVLVTGAGGSIGSELCRQALRFKPTALVLVDHSENTIFAIENELRAVASALRQHDDSPATQIHPVIADIRFASRMTAIFEAHRPSIVFHAGAHKHVPLMEHNPSEAISNNVRGTQCVLDASRAVEVERFVFVSTDKAVRPTSVMGASKRVAEMLVHQASAETGKTFLAVRFGNVLGSSGSVVLTMEQQIAAGGPVTITHPDMARFFMTIPEAVQLILQAAVLGRGGQVLMFDMGEPVRIVDLADDLIRLSGLSAGEDIDVVFTGVRPGEKLQEELFMPGERYEQTGHEKIYIAGRREQHHVHELERLVSDLVAASELGDDIVVRRLLRRLVPDYRPDLSPGQAPDVERSPTRARDEVVPRSGTLPDAAVS